MDAGDVARRSFAIVRRGFDPEEVREYLELLAKALEHADQREQELLHALEAAEERARHPVIDESVLTASLGQRSAAVLRGAHEEAARILAQAEEAAAAMVHEAQQQATDMQVNAESATAERIAHAELEATSLEQQARETAGAVVETARVEGEALIERAREQGRAMLDQAQEARRRVLADMGHRRRLVAEQIELLRAARDEIAGSVVGVRRSLDRIVEDLSHADESARAAAAAGRAHAVDVPEHVLVEEAERAVAELGDLERDAAGEGGSGEAGREEAVRGEAGGEGSHGEGAPAGSSRPMLRFDDVASVVQRSDTDEHGAEGRGSRGAGPSAVHDWQQDDPSAASSVAAEEPSADEAHGDEAHGDEAPGDEGPGDEAPGDEAPGDEGPGDEGPGDEGSPDQPVPVSAAAGDPPAGGADVDGLFARLRARHGVPRTEADAAATGATTADESGAEPVGAAPADAGDEAGEAARTGPDDGADEGAGEEPSADAAMFAQRAEALDPIVSNLSRRLKRGLQDDQNGLLDRFRQGTGEWSDALLLDEGSQRSLYAKAAAASLRDAMSAGMVFARAVAGGRRPKTVVPDDTAVDAIGQELASTVVTLIRRRLETGDTPDAAERIGAAYREWRGERIQRLAEDSVIEAFSKGVLAASAKRTVRWSRSEVGPGCADCEDNCLAGDVVAGQEFPTGHLHPPAHAGCRCLVLPTTS